jgi:hypothetical protein
LLNKLTGGFEPNTGQSGVKPDGEVCANTRPSNLKKYVYLHSYNQKMISNNVSNEHNKHVHAVIFTEVICI